MPYVTLSEHDGVFHLREIADESVDALDSAGIHVHLIGEAELAAWEGHCAASAAWHAHWIRVKNDGYERADRRMLEEELHHLPLYEALRKKDEELTEAARKISALRALLKEKEQT